MTVIAAAENDKIVCIASDSMGVSGHTLTELGPKLIKKNNYIIGFSNSYRVADIIRECNKFPKTIESLASLRKFRDVLKALLLEDGCTDKGEQSDTVSHPVDIIIISPKGIYTVETDYQIHNIKDYVATGSGVNFALGAMYAEFSYKDDFSPYNAVEFGVRAAIRHCASCGGDVYIETIRKKK